MRMCVCHACVCVRVSRHCTEVAFVCIYVCLSCLCERMCVCHACVSVRGGEKQKQMGLHVLSFFGGCVRKSDLSHRKLGSNVVYMFIPFELDFGVASHPPSLPSSSSSFQASASPSTSIWG